MNRFEVFLVNLEPTIGVEIRKIRPCVIVSPNEMNDYIKTVIIAPLTTKTRSYPTRVACKFEGKQAFVVLDQLRTVDKVRLYKYLGKLDDTTQVEILEILQEMFA